MIQTDARRSGQFECELSGMLGTSQDKRKRRDWLSIMRTNFRSVRSAMKTVVILDLARKALFVLSPPFQVPCMTVAGLLVMMAILLAPRCEIERVTSPFHQSAPDMARASGF